MVADAGDGEAPFPDTWSQAAAWAFRSLEKSAGEIRCSKGLQPVRPAVQVRDQRQALGAVELFLEPFA